MNGRKFELLGWKIHKSIIKIRLSKVNKNWVCFWSLTKKNNLGYRLLVQVSRILLTYVLFQHSSQQTLCALFWLVLSLIVQFFFQNSFHTASKSFVFVTFISFLEFDIWNVWKIKMKGLKSSELLKNNIIREWVLARHIGCICIKISGRYLLDQVTTTRLWETWLTFTIWFLLSFSLGPGCSTLRTPWTFSWRKLLSWEWSRVSPRSCWWTGLATDSTFSGFFW